jgi:hypothetical protein
LPPFLVGALVSFPAAAMAGELGFRGPPECNRKSEITEGVESLAGRSLVSVDDYDFDVEVEKKGASEWQLVLVTKTRASGALRERRFQGKTCAEVGDAAAVAISMTLRNDSGDSAAPPAETKAPPEEPPVAAPAATPTRRDEGPAPAKPAPPNAAEPLSILVGVGALVDAGSLPSVAPGGTLSAGALLRPLRIELQGGLFAPQKTESAPNQGGTFNLAFGALVACYEKNPKSVHALACLGYELGSLSGEGYGVAEPRSGSSFWHAVRVELGAGLPLSDGLSLSLRAGAAVPLARKAFVLDEAEVVHEPNAVSGRAQAGLEMSL